MWKHQQRCTFMTSSLSRARSSVPYWYHILSYVVKHVLSLMLSAIICWYLSPFYPSSKFPVFYLYLIFVPPSMCQGIRPSNMEARKCGPNMSLIANIMTTALRPMLPPHGQSWIVQKKTTFFLLRYFSNYKTKKIGLLQYPSKPGDALGSILNFIVSPMGHPWSDISQRRSWTSHTPGSCFDCIGWWMALPGNCPPAFKVWKTDENWNLPSGNVGNIT